MDGARWSYYVHGGKEEVSCGGVTCIASEALGHPSAAPLCAWRGRCEGCDEWLMVWGDKEGTEFREGIAG